MNFEEFPTLKKPVDPPTSNCKEIEMGIDAMIKSLESDAKKLQATSDCNQNVIEPNSCSFEQLCSMINDLERNTSGDRINYPEKNEAHLVEERYKNQVEPEKDCSNQLCSAAGSTYEDIMSFLGTLEQDETGYVNDSQIEKSDKNSKSILQELFTENQFHYCPGCNRNNRTVSLIPNTLKEDLATAKLQLEEREATIRFLKNELRTERQLACEKIEAQTKQHTAAQQTQKSKYQTVVKRHQKFIEQLLSEKKDLSEKCNFLADRIKEMEAKHLRESKVVAERHTVELQRARELCAASEKIRRERWLEAKTSKIKEMTVKGLEPELRSMVEQHQQDIQEIRSAHIKELQDMELRTIRRSNQQLEQLRLELVASHEKMMSNEKEILRARYEEKMEEQEKLFRTQHRKLIDELQQERNLFVQQQAKMHSEKDAAVQQAYSHFQEKINALNRQHQIEKKSFQESLRVEQETWMENYRRQQSVKFERAEGKIREECNRERDRQIEIAIERLERETRDMKNDLQKSSQNKLRSLKEKYETELKDAAENEQLLKSKMTLIQKRLKDTENQLEISENKLRDCSCDLNACKQSMDKMKMERDNAKRVVRQEIEMEKRGLEEKISSLYRELAENNSNREALMGQVYSRIKLIVTQKDLLIRNLKEEVEGMKKRCDHLEKLLDHQRKEYVLKSL
ncbi:centrosomal protein of 131 kDa isoform X2 [Cephus cinctus]|nr:centrosomal protein of 131 kDa isoform X2 [Cephus cinctus]